MPQNASDSALSPDTKQVKSLVEQSNTDGSVPDKSAAGVAAAAPKAGGTGPSIEVLRQLTPKGIRFQKTVRGAVRSLGYKKKPKYSRWKKSYSRYPRRRSFYRRRYY